MVTKHYNYFFLKKYQNRDKSLEHNQNTKSQFLRGFELWV